MSSIPMSLPEEHLATTVNGTKDPVSSSRLLPCHVSMSSRPDFMTSDHRVAVQALPDAKPLFKRIYRRFRPSKSRWFWKFHPHSILTFRVQNRLYFRLDHMVRPHRSPKFSMFQATFLLNPPTLLCAVSIGHAAAFRRTDDPRQFRSYEIVNRPGADLAELPRGSEPFS